MPRNFGNKFKLLRIDIFIVVMQMHVLRNTGLTSTLTHTFSSKNQCKYQPNIYNAADHRLPPPPTLNTAFKVLQKSFAN